MREGSRPEDALIDITWDLGHGHIELHPAKRTTTQISDLGKLLNSEKSTAYVNLMKDIESEFMTTTGMSDRGFYKIFCSHIHRFPLLVLGINPGGTPGASDLLSASVSYCENWEHDFVCFKNDPRYTMAGPAFDFLCKMLRTNDVNVIRQIPVTNVMFSAFPVVRMN